MTLPPSRVWCLLWLGACADSCEEAAGPPDGGDSEELPSAHQGVKEGPGATGSGPRKGEGTVAFPGSVLMDTTVLGTATPVAPGETEPAPTDDRPTRSPPETDATYLRFFVSLDDAGEPTLANEPVLLPGTLVPPAWPQGTLLVVASNGNTDLGLASFVDGRTQRGFRAGETDDHGEAAAQSVLLPISAPTGTTKLSVWELPRDAVPWTTALTLDELPTLTANATLLGTVDYKP